MSDLNLLRSVVTLVAFIAFIVLVARVWRRSERAGHDEAAALVFADERPGDAPSDAGPRSARP